MYLNKDKILNSLTKDEIINCYSMPEVKLFYEKILKEDMRRQADYIESVTGGIGMAFGGAKDIIPVLKSLRGR